MCAESEGGSDSLPLGLGGGQKEQKAFQFSLPSFISLLTFHVTLSHLPPPRFVLGLYLSDKLEHSPTFRRLKCSREWFTVALLKTACSI